MIEKLIEALKEIRDFPQAGGDSTADIVDAMREIAKEGLCSNEF